MVCLLSPASERAREAGMFCRRVWWALRRRCCPRSVLLVGVAICLFYQTLVVARSRFKASPTVSNQPNKSKESDGQSAQLPIKHPERLLSVIEGLRNETTKGQLIQLLRGGNAVVLTGRQVATDTEVQLYQRVLQQYGFRVGVFRHTEAAAALRQDIGQSGDGDWSVLICLPGSERSCRKEMDSRHILSHQRVNTIPGIARAFSDSDGLCRFQSDSRLSGLEFPIIPSACVQPRAAHGPSRTEWARPSAPLGPGTGRGFVATVKVYVLITSVTPLTAFFHPAGLVRTHPSSSGYVTTLQAFFLKQLGANASLALENMREAMGGVLLAAAATGASEPHGRCSLCFQLLTVTLHFNASLHPVIGQVQKELHFEDMEDPDFEGQITRELILEDVLNFLLSAHAQSNNVLTRGLDALIGEKYGGCVGTNGACLPPDQALSLLQFVHQLKTPGPFKLLYPASSPRLAALQRRLYRRFRTPEDSGRGVRLATLLDLARLFQNGNQTGMGESQGWGGRKPSEYSQNSQLEKDYSWWSDCGHEKCLDPHLRQVYTDPQLVLVPPFSPWVKEYRAEVPFDVVTVRIRAEPVDCRCQVHLDERRGPRISILVMDESEPERVIMTIYRGQHIERLCPVLPIWLTT
ncbi:hypothetical protein AAFF_G00174100 [Aldrovandia affinis]|uniref:Uncharacterized protein n=1 Tax=Aldrovandia affinis TaxID=143900 RepID=A0AAD7WX12_9TELE|nr:hypothetical protein AAFF_G00174100 [Aldrovandia affinis]